MQRGRLLEGLAKVAGCDRRLQSQPTCRLVTLALSVTLCGLPVALFGTLRLTSAVISLAPVYCTRRITVALSLLGIPQVGARIPAVVLCGTAVRALH
jgi:hypothetical protein